MIIQTMLMQGTCGDASVMAALLAKFDGVKGLAHTIESGPEGCEAEDFLGDDAVALHLFVAEVPDQCLANRICEFASFAAKLLDTSIRFQGPVVGDRIIAANATALATSRPSR